MTDLTVADVAKELALHYETVRRLIQHGKIPGYKAGVRQWRVTREGMNAYKIQRGNASFSAEQHSGNALDKTVIK